jgi:C4-type Zn-finger protein
MEKISRQLLDEEEGERERQREEMERKKKRKTEKRSSVTERIFDTESEAFVHATPATEPHVDPTNTEQFFLLRWELWRAQLLTLSTNLAKPWKPSKR